MSADNMICIQKRLDGRFYVWMDFASEDEYTPPEDAVSFPTRGEADVYALGWLRGESIVEYGIVDLKDEESREEEAVDHICAHCIHWNRPSSWFRSDEPFYARCAKLACFIHTGVAVSIATNQNWSDRLSTPKFFSCGFWEKK